MRRISVIASDIRSGWAKPYFGAVPYIDAMSYLNTVDDMYGADRADMIIRYFLSNATTWRGDTARMIKAELRALLS